MTSLPPIDQQLATRKLTDRKVDFRKDEDLEAATEKFEGLVLHELMKAMRSTVPKDEDSFGLEMSSSMFDQAIADSGAGHLGLRRMLMREFGGGSGGENEIRPAHINPATLPTPAHSLPKPVAPSRYGAFVSGLPTNGHMPVDGVISSDYGRRVHPVTGKHSFHEGLDIAAPEGTEVTTVKSGRVVRAGRQGSYGMVVEVDHGDSVVTRYAHLSRIHVRAGDKVEVGESVGDVGSTGRSTGPHLHFEVLVNKEAVNPEKYLTELRSEAKSAH